MKCDLVFVVKKCSKPFAEFKHHFRNDCRNNKTAAGHYI